MGLLLCIADTTTRRLAPASSVNDEFTDQGFTGSCRTMYLASFRPKYSPAPDCTSSLTGGSKRRAGTVCVTVTADGLDIGWPRGLRIVEGGEPGAGNTRVMRMFSAWA